MVLHAEAVDCNVFIVQYLLVIKKWLVKEYATDLQPKNHQINYDMQQARSAALYVVYIFIQRNLRFTGVLAAIQN